MAAWPYSLVGYRLNCASYVGRHGQIPNNQTDNRDGK
jgi:hypothetical protein